MLGYAIAAFHSLKLDLASVSTLCELTARFFHRTTIVSANVTIGIHLAAIQSRCRYVMSRRIDQVLKIVAAYPGQTLTPALRRISQKVAAELNWTRIGVTCCFECNSNNDNYMVNFFKPKSIIFEILC
jgi:hypothetical protein